MRSPYGSRAQALAVFEEGALKHQFVIGVRDEYIAETVDVEFG